MIEYVNSVKAWPRWNDLIFRDGKPAIVFSMSKNHALYPRVRDMLSTMKRTSVFYLQPNDYMKLTMGSDEVILPPCIIGYDKGERVYAYSTEHISKDARDVLLSNLDDVEYELCRLFV